MPEERKTALIVVRTYPTPAKKGVEVSCTAAITDNGEWLRLFPVPFRFLPSDQRFRKYQWVEVTVMKASDPRPESYKLKVDGIKILSDPLSTANGWKARKDVILPLRAHCLCCLQRQRDEQGRPTLGLFQPKVIESLTIKAEHPAWTHSQLAILRQGHLFEKGPETELEKIPFSFRYGFRCDDDACKGHKMICTDWEMGQSWRKWKAEYGDSWEAKFRQRYETEMIKKYDTHFYVGTVHQHPSTWIIVGLFYPPRPEPTDLGLFSHSD
ncbi:MAG: hypothetical protein ACRD19_09665 [Terriglobia bacterium]